MGGEEGVFESGYDFVRIGMAKSTYLVLHSTQYKYELIIASLTSLCAFRLEETW